MRDLREIDGKFEAVDLFDVFLVLEYIIKNVIDGFFHDKFKVLQGC